jgi:hypothetical protein
MGDVGPNFDKGVRRIGRRRLPAGFVAILDDPETLRLAIRELHEYAVSGTKVGKRGIVFRVVTSQERQAILFKLQNLLGIENFTKSSATFHISEGHWHAIDSEHVTHVINRHGDLEAEQNRHGHLPITIEDFQLLPQLVDPRNIVQFFPEERFPRMKYRREVSDRTLILIQEIRVKDGIVMKTLYREK